MAKVPGNLPPEVLAIAQMFMGQGAQGQLPGAVAPNRVLQTPGPRGLPPGIPAVPTGPPPSRPAYSPGKGAAGGATPAGGPMNKVQNWLKGGPKNWAWLLPMIAGYLIKGQMDQFQQGAMGDIQLEGLRGMGETITPESTYQEATAPQIQTELDIAQQMLLMQMMGGQQNIAAGEEIIGGSGGGY